LNSTVSVWGGVIQQQVGLALKPAAGQLVALAGRVWGACRGGPRARRAGEGLAYRGAGLNAEAGVKLMAR